MRITHTPTVRKQDIMQRESKLEVSIGSFPLEMRENPLDTQRIENMRETWPIESAKQDAHGLTESEAASSGPAWVCTRSSAYML